MRPFSKRFRISAQVSQCHESRGTTHADEKKLRTLGEAWIAFYQDHLTQAELHDVYQALVLASVPACGPVMAELAEILLTKPP